MVMNVILMFQSRRIGYRRCILVCKLIQFHDTQAMITVVITLDLIYF